MALKIEVAMGYPALKVANTLVSLAHRQGMPVSGPQVQKLIYFAHATLLARFGRPLVKEEFAAWQHGPLLESLYHEFKLLGTGPLPTEGWPMQRLGFVAADDDAALQVLQSTLQECRGVSLSVLIQRSKLGAWASQPETARYIHHDVIRQHRIDEIQQSEPDFKPPPMQTPAMALVPRETLTRLANYLCGGHYEPRNRDEAALAAEIIAILESLPKPTHLEHLKTGNTYYRLGSVHDCTNSRAGTTLAQYVPTDQPYIEPFVREVGEFESKFVAR